VIDAAWFARATELPLLHVTYSADLRGAASASATRLRSRAT